MKYRLIEYKTKKINIRLNSIEFYYKHNNTWNNDDLKRLERTQFNLNKLNIFFDNSIKKYSKYDTLNLYLNFICNNSLIYFVANYNGDKNKFYFRFSNINSISLVLISNEIDKFNEIERNILEISIQDLIDFILNFNEE